MRIDYHSFAKKYVRPPKNQFPVGSIVFKGFQGSGKTLSMVHYLKDLRHDFPKCIVYSNVILKNFGNYELIKTSKDLTHAIARQNGADGVVVVLDEAHLFFNKKDGISLDVLTAISQQRKDRRRIVMSSQIWEELDISLRKQVKHIVSCRCLLGRIQVNTISDGETLTYDKLQGCYTAKKIYTEVFKHNKELYDSYDTYQKIISNKDYHREYNSTNNTTTIIKSVKAKK